MSQLNYNGVTLAYCFTTDLRQEAVRDDQGDTDFCLTKFDIQVQSVLNVAYLAQLVPDIVAQVGREDFSNSAADIMNMVRKRLLAHRRPLSFIFNGVELIPKVDNQVGYVDAMNGPKPQHCSITPVTNETFLLRYHIIAHYWECPRIDREVAADGPGQGQLVRQGQGGTPVLFNRWSERVEIDEKNYSKRIREGKYMIRSDNATGVTVDELRRDMAVVGVPEGFLRESSEYQVSPDGLSLQYRLVDQEVATLPPDGSFKADGEYIETSTKWDAKRYGEVRVHLQGSKTTPKATLLEKAVEIGASKLYKRNFANFSFLGLLEFATLNIKLYDNDVEIRFRALLNPQSDNSGTGRLDELWGFRLDKIAETPLSISAISPPPYTVRGDTPILLRAAAYFDPCLNQKLSCTDGQIMPGLVPGTAGTTAENPGATKSPPPFFLSDNTLVCNQMTPSAFVTVGVGTILPDDFNAQYQKTSNADRSIWTDFVVQNRYESDKHLYMLPLASPARTDTFTENSNGVAFVQLAAPTLLWISDWTATRTNEKPLIPNVDTGDADWITLDEHYEPDMVTVAPDGVTPIYRISGTFVYGHRNPGQASLSDINFGRPPWLKDVYPRTLSNSDQADDLLLQRGSLTDLP